MKEYTVGFIFTPDLKEVLLMHKNRPDFQVGKLNGVGGKIEEGETLEACFIREVREETNISLEEEGIKKVGCFDDSGRRIYIMAVAYSGDKNNAKTMTDEQVLWIPTQELPEHVLSELRWFVPLCIDVLRIGKPKNVQIEF